MRRPTHGWAALAALTMLPTPHVAALPGGPPPNDDCADAIVIADGVQSGTTTGATVDGPGTCGDSAASPDVWYQYTTPIDGMLDVSTCGSPLNTVIGLWDACPGKGTEVLCNDNCCILQSAIYTMVEQGETFLIRVAGWNGAAGDFDLTVETTPVAVGPDVIYQNIHAIADYGSVGDIHAYSLGSYTCNIGDANLSWDAASPLWTFNAYRLLDGRLEQIGMSWVKNATTATATAGCGVPCNGAGGCVLGAGCRDVYSATFNGIQLILGPRSGVNPLTGTYSGADLNEGDAIYKRLQIAEADLNAPGALYFVEGQFVAADDAASGNAMNNASYRRVNTGAGFQLIPADNTEFGEPAIQAWRNHGGGIGIPDPAVQVEHVDVPGDGRFHVASKAISLGEGMWRYTYAVRNHNSARAASAFSIPYPTGAVLANIGFHDVDYHSGEVYDDTDWSPVVGPSLIRWTSPETYNQNPDTNALRWATMYTFWFDANAGPVDGAGTVSLFVPGSPSSVQAPAVIPGELCASDVTGDGTVDVADLVSLIVNWGPCPGDCPQDIDGDGEVDVPDLVQVILDWGPC